MMFRFVFWDVLHGNTSQKTILNILSHVKVPFEVLTKILRKAKLIVFFANYSCFATR